MASEKIRNPKTDHLITPENSALLIIDYQPLQVAGVHSMNTDELAFNIAAIAKAAKYYGVPIIHSTVNVSSGLNKPAIQQLQDVIGDLPTYDRTTVNAWEDVEFKEAVKSLGRKKLIVTALWTEVCLAFPSLDALFEGYEVYIPVDAVGGTTVVAHEAGLRRIEQAGGKMTSRVQLFCEFQRDWARKDTIPGFMDVFKSFEGVSNH
jgi:nicotinamidase-related amidase